MNNKEIERIIMRTLRKVISSKERLGKVAESMEEKKDGFIIYLSHGATLGEAWEIQDELKKEGLAIPEQIGNAVIYVTSVPWE